MKIAFVTIGAEYIGVELMAAYLRRTGHEVKAYCDESVFDDKNYFTIPWLARLFNRRKQVIEQIVRYKPDMLGISVITNSYQWALEIARGVKGLAPEIEIIFGGVHTTSVPDEVIGQECVDMICVGEGQEAIVELAGSFDAGDMRTDISNIWFKSGGNVIKNPQRPQVQDINTMPLIDKSVYEGEVPLHLSYLALSQYGCPFSCSYCAVTTLNSNSKSLGGKSLRFMSVDNVIREIKTYKDKYGFDSVFFMTNTFTSDKQWVMEFAEKYPREVRLPYKVATHPTKIDYETACALKKSGCYTVQLGVESFSEDVRENIFHRRESNDSVIQATRAMDKAGLRYTIDYIMGAPLQTEDEYRSAAEFFMTLNCCIRITSFIISVFPNTPLVQVGIRHGMLDNEGIERLNKGLDPNFVTSGSLVRPEVLRELNMWRFFYRLIPVMPVSISRFLLTNGRFKKLGFLPIGGINLFVDVATSLWTRDYVALGYLRMYIWNIKKVVKLAFRWRLARLKLFWSQ